MSTAPTLDSGVQWQEGGCRIEWGGVKWIRFRANGDQVVLEQLWFLPLFQDAWHHPSCGSGGGCGNRLWGGEGREEDEGGRQERKLMLGMACAWHIHITVLLMSHATSTCQLLATSPYPDRFICFKLCKTLKTVLSVLLYAKNTPQVFCVNWRPLGTPTPISNKWRLAYSFQKTFSAVCKYYFEYDFTLFDYQTLLTCTGWYYNSWYYYKDK